MSDEVRTVLHKSKLELADVWSNYHVEKGWKNKNGEQLLKIAKEQATRLEEQARGRKGYYAQAQALALREHEPEPEPERARDELHGNDRHQTEINLAKKQLKQVKQMLQEVDELRDSQSQRLNNFHSKVSDKNHSWWTRQKQQADKKKAMECMSL